MIKRETCEAMGAQSVPGITAPLQDVDSVGDFLNVAATETISQAILNSSF